MEKKGLMLFLMIVVLVLFLLFFLVLNSGFNFTGKVVEDEASCIDSDGGRNYYVRGSVRVGEDYVYVDICDVAFDKLIENWCETTDSGNLIRKWEYTECENGCVNGTCIEGNETQEEKPNCVEGEIKEGAYCFGGVFVSQLDKDELCMNDFECKAGICDYGKCGKRGLVERIINWFRNLFS